MSDPASIALASVANQIARLEVVPDVARLACSALRSDEEECFDGRHTLKPDAVWTRKYYDAKKREYVYIDAVGGAPSRVCPLIAYREEQVRLGAPIAMCMRGGTLDANTPIGLALLRRLDQQREVVGLKDALRTTKALLDDMAGNGHVAFVGTVGTAKTHLLLALYLSALWSGLSAWWLTSGDLRDVAKDRNSFDDVEQDRARTRLRTWQKRRLLVIDDLGDRLSDQRARDPGASQVAALLLDLLNGTTARLFWSSNLDEPKLNKHPDIGPRAVSRLFADHNGLACKVVTLGGEDQRQHAMRSL